MAISRNGPIGVFDSGSGGLTVYRALRDVLPQEDFIYFADTARLPYGTKSPETVSAYALQIAEALIDEGIKMLVVACNTATAHALPALKQHMPSLPCFGVIDPGAQAAAKVSSQGRIAVLATQGTVQSGAYEAAIRQHKPFAQVRMLACNLLTSLVEEGWWDGPEVESVVRRYLNELGEPGKDYDTLVLGCTHFPLLAPVIRKLIGPQVAMVDSAMTTAASVHRHLVEARFDSPAQESGHSRFLVTDSAERFGLLAARFVAGEHFVPGSNVFHIDIGAGQGRGTAADGIRKALAGSR